MGLSRKCLQGGGGGNGRSWKISQIKEGQYVDALGSVSVMNSWRGYLKIVMRWKEKVYMACTSGAKLSETTGMVWNHGIISKKVLRTDSWEIAWENQKGKEWGPFFVTVYGQMVQRGSRTFFFLPDTSGEGGVGTRNPQQIWFWKKEGTVSLEMSAKVV